MERGYGGYEGYGEHGEHGEHDIRYRRYRQYPFQNLLLSSIDFLVDGREGERRNISGGRLVGIYR